MKKIGKRVIAIALAMCSVFSTTTAFAAPVDTDELDVSTYCAPAAKTYHILGEASVEITKYSSCFDFTATVKSPVKGKVDLLGVKYRIIDYNTGKQYGLEQSYYEEHVNSVSDFYSVPLERLSPVAAQCYYFAFQDSVTLMDRESGSTFVIAE